MKWYYTLLRCPKRRPHHQMQIFCHILDTLFLGGDVFTSLQGIRILNLAHRAKLYFLYLSLSLPPSLYLSIYLSYKKKKNKCVHIIRTTNLITPAVSYNTTRLLVIRRIVRMSELQPLFTFCSIHTLLNSETLIQ